MPCIQYGCYVGGDPRFSARGENYHPRPHQDHTAPKGFASCEQMAMVHLPIPINKAMKIPDAKKAVDAEWLAHHQKKTWNVNKVRPKAEVIAEAQKNNKSVHFGRLMDLCHLKHAELEQQVQKYKGRVVFRGDQVKDETGFYAVFTEQGASASQMAAAKFLDTIARMPGMSGQAADAVKAYTSTARQSTCSSWTPKGRMPGYMDLSAAFQTASLLEKHQGPSMSIGAKSLRTPTCGTIVGKASGRSIE